MARAFVSQGLGEGMKLGTPAGDLERQARRLERQGYRGQAGDLMREAALLRAENRGFSSSERNITNMRREQDVQNQVLAEQADTVLGGQPETPAPGGGMMQEARASRLDASPTPGLDAQDLSQSRPMAAPAPDNLAQRRSLFAEMRAAGDQGTSDTFRQRAAALGVDDTGWSIASERLAKESFSPESRVIRPQAPAAPAAPKPDPNVFTVGGVPVKGGGIGKPAPAKTDMTMSQIMDASRKRRAARNPGEEPYVSAGYETEEEYEANKRSPSRLGVFAGVNNILSTQ